MKLRALWKRGRDFLSHMAHPIGDRFRAFQRKLQVATRPARHAVSLGRKQLAGKVVAADRLTIVVIFVGGLIVAGTLFHIINAVLVGRFLEDRLHPQGEPTSTYSPPFSFSNTERRYEIQLRDVDQDTSIIKWPERTSRPDDAKEASDGDTSAPLAQNGHYVPLRQYVVVADHNKSKNDILIVEAGLRKSAREWSLEFHLGFADSLNPPQPRDGEQAASTSAFRLAWHETGGIAKSNAIFQLERSWAVPGRPIFSYVSFPTSPTALTSYLRSYWGRRLNPLLPTNTNLQIDEEDFRIVADDLDQALRRDFGDIQTAWPVLWLRTQNGSVQWITIGAFLAGVYTCLARGRLWTAMKELLDEFRDREQGALNQRRPLTEQIKDVEDAQEEFARAWGMPAFVLTLWRESLVAHQRTPQSASTRTAEFAEIESDILESQTWSTRYFLQALPALGFIGTVIGIGYALGSTGNVLSEDLAHQQSGVLDVALQLSFAFDTTLVGLLGALVLGFWNANLESEELRLLTETRRFCLTALSPTATATQDHIPAAMPPRTPPPPPFNQPSSQPQTEQKFVARPAPPSLSSAAITPQGSSGEGGHRLRIDSPDDYQKYVAGSWFGRLSLFVMSAALGVVLAAAVYFLVKR